MSAFLEFVNRQRAVVLPVVAAASLIAAAAITWWIARSFTRPTSPSRIAQAYFYDLNTGTLYTAAADETGPLETPSGSFAGHPAGVRAVVFSCDSCNDPAQQFVGWLEMPDAEFQLPSLEEDETTDDEPSSVLIRREHGTHWHPIDSREAELIMEQVQQHCGEGKTPRYCHPRSAIAR